MDFSNDLIGQKVEKQMSELKQQGVRFDIGTEYNRVFEAFYKTFKDAYIFRDALNKIIDAKESALSTQDLFPVLQLIDEAKKIL